MTPGTSSIRLSVAICTWNRADLLEQTLLQMENLRLRDDIGWELIVVNNRCTDHTDEVIERFSQRLPVVRIFESQQGQCHARNAVIQAATGDWILWTDDDVLVDENWICAYADAIRENSQFSIAGGTIEPWFATAPPNWLHRHLANLEGAFAIIRRDEKTRPLVEGESLFGANMAFRTDVLRQNLFDTSLGLIGDNSTRGDETELIERLQRNGHRGLWIGKAKVKHYIPTRRMTTRYLWSFYHGYGRAITRQADRTRTPTLFGRPRWALRSYAVSNLFSGLAGPLKNEFWLKQFRNAATCAGIIAETVALQKHGN